MLFYQSNLSFKLHFKLFSLYALQAALNWHNCVCLSGDLNEQAWQKAELNVDALNKKRSAKQGGVLSAKFIVSLKKKKKHFKIAIIHPTV